MAAWLMILAFVLVVFAVTAVLVFMVNDLMPIPPKYKNVITIVLVCLGIIAIVLKIIP